MRHPPPRPSLWHDTLPADERSTSRPPLPGDRTADVAIVGAGFTGLWTARALAIADPALRIVVLEAETAGFGASGRNGGWCSALLPMSPAAIARATSPGAAVAMVRAARAAVGEVIEAAAQDGIDADIEHAGNLRLARSPLQLDRLRAEQDDARRWGAVPSDLELLDRRAARRLVAADGVVGALFTPHCAALHPAKLARGLARAVERRGVTVHERTPVIAIEPGRVRTAHGTVQAEVVVRATEGFTARLPGMRRVLAPIYSLMIATEPLPDRFWSEVGWQARVTLDDARHLIVYAQRTADGRIAFGGRGAPYHLASRVDPRFDQEPAVFAALERALVELFPSLHGVAITHRWGGPLAVARDWWSSVGYDRRRGLAWAGGYVGDGVALTNLAGRTLAELILGQDGPLIRLPWVGHHSRRWEPEPLRWIGINSGLRLAGAVDDAEQRSGRTPRGRARLLRSLLG